MTAIEKLRKKLEDPNIRDFSGAAIKHNELGDAIIELDERLKFIELTLLNDGK